MNLRLLILWSYQALEHLPMAVWLHLQHQPQSLDIVSVSLNSECHGGTFVIDQVVQAIVGNTCLEKKEFGEYNQLCLFSIESTVE